MLTEKIWLENKMYSFGMIFKSIQPNYPMLKWYI